MPAWGLQSRLLVANDSPGIGRPSISADLRHCFCEGGRLNLSSAVHNIPLGALFL